MNLDTDLTIKGHYRFTIASPEEIVLVMAEYFKGWNPMSCIDIARVMFTLPQTPEPIDGHPDVDNYNIWEHWYEICAGMKDGKFTPKYFGLRQAETDNLVPNVLKYSLATLISGTSVTPSFKVNYLALGTGSTAPAANDTQLQTETLRGIIEQRQAINNVAYLSTYFGSAQVAGNTYLEAGMFVDGSAGANTGYLLSHVAINQAIGSNQSLTINASITLN